MERVFIGVGSNEGERFDNISESLRRLSRVPGVCVIQMAPVIETEPVGGPPQDPYLNTVAELETVLEPLELLDVLKSIEAAMGRKPAKERWTPRPIDLDILLYGEHVFSHERLIIPHVLLHERRFVLEPLVQLASHVEHPVLKRTAVQLLEALDSTAAAAR